MDTFYTATATSWGGRDGKVRTSDGVIDMEVRPPKEMGGSGGGYTNPEQLFAAGYAACFNSALFNAGRRKRMNLGDSVVQVTVSIGKDGEGNYSLAAAIEAMIPNVTQEQADELAAMAHEICPYSRATKGNIEVAVRARVLSEGEGAR